MNKFKKMRFLVFFEYFLMSFLILLGFGILLWVFGECYSRYIHKCPPCLTQEIPCETVQFETGLRSGKI